MLYHFGHLAVVRWTIFHDVIDVANLTYYHSSLIQHKPQLSQFLILIFIDKLLEKTIMVLYDYIMMLGLSLAQTITTSILTSTNLACYQMCKLSSFAYLLLIHHCLLESDGNGCRDLYASLNHEKLCSRYRRLVVSKTPWMTVFPTCSKHRGIFHGFCNVEVIYCRKEEITIRATYSHVNNDIVYWIVFHNSTCGQFNAVLNDKFC